jgi:hypothetical protein
MKGSVYLMKKVFLFIVLVSMLSVAMSAPIFYEGFNYTFGDISTVSAGAWFAHSGTVGQWSTMNTASDSGNSLSYAGLAASAGSRLYKDKVFTEDVHRDFSSVYSVSTPGSIYYSFLIKVTEAPTFPHYCVHLYESTITTNRFPARVFVISTTFGGSTGVNFGVMGTSAGVTTYTSNFYPLNTSHLVVVKLSMPHDGINIDTAYLWVNPTVGQPETVSSVYATETGASLAVQPSAGIGGIALRAGTTNQHGNMEIDEIRVGATWADVLPPSSTNVAYWESFSE